MISKTRFCCISITQGVKEMKYESIFQDFSRKADLFERGLEIHYGSEGQWKAHPVHDAFFDGIWNHLAGMGSAKKLYT